jgi:hypothetical protein
VTLHHLLSSLALFVFIASTSAQAAPGAQEPTQKSQAIPDVQKRSETTRASAKQAEMTEADYKALRERDEARQQMWDKKMKALTRSICTGC